MLPPLPAEAVIVWDMGTAVTVTIPDFVNVLLPAVFVAVNETSKVPGNVIDVYRVLEGAGIAVAEVPHP